MPSQWNAPADGRQRVPHGPPSTAVPPGKRRHGEALHPRKKRLPSRFRFCQTPPSSPSAGHPDSCSLSAKSPAAPLSLFRQKSPAGWTVPARRGRKSPAGPGRGTDRPPSFRPSQWDKAKIPERLWKSPAAYKCGKMRTASPPEGICGLMRLPPVPGPAPGRNAASPAPYALPAHPAR